MDDGVKIGATVTFPSTRRQDAGAGALPGRAVDDAVRARRGVRLSRRRQLFATRGMIGAWSPTCAGPAAAAATSAATTSPRVRRATATTWSSTSGRARTRSGKVGMAGGSYVGITQYLTAERRPPHLAAITPQVAHQRPVPRRLRARRHPQPPVRRPVHRRAGRARVRRGRTAIRTCCSRRSRPSSGQSPPGTIAFDYLSRPDDDDFYRDRSPIYNADRIKVPVLDLGQWHDGLLRGETEMYRRAGAAAAASRLASIWTRARTRAAGRRSTPLTNPPDLNDTNAVIFEFLAKYLQGRATPDRPPVAVLPPGRRTGTSTPTAGRRPARRRGATAARPGTLGSPAAGGSATGTYVTNPLAGFSMAFDQYGTVARNAIHARPTSASRARRG